MTSYQMMLGTKPCTPTSIQNFGNQEARVSATYAVSTRSIRAQSRSTAQRQAQPSAMPSLNDPLDRRATTARTWPTTLVTYYQLYAIFGPSQCLEGPNRCATFHNFSPALHSIAQYATTCCRLWHAHTNIYRGGDRVPATRPPPPPRP